MKLVTLLATTLLVFLSAGYADIPPSFDPRPQNQGPIQGCGFIIQPSPFTGDYLIITSLDHSFLTFAASASPSLKLGAIAGQFVLIEAIRTRPTDQEPAPLLIISATRITKW